MPSLAQLKLACDSSLCPSCLQYTYPCIPNFDAVEKLKYKLPMWINVKIGWHGWMGGGEGMQSGSWPELCNLQVSPLKTEVYW